MRHVWALVERELIRFLRNPLLILFTILGPLLQLAVLGYAFGGTLHGLRVAVVDEDHGVQALRLRERAQAVAAGPGTFEAVPYADEAGALAALRTGTVSGVVIIPPGYTRRVLARQAPQVALVENNVDRFVSTALAGALKELVAGLGQVQVTTARLPAEVALAVVELHPFVPYVQYLLPGTVVLAIFTMVMLGGAFAFMDDKVLGIHEGYLVTPVTRLELMAAFNLSGAIKAVSAGVVLTLVGLVLSGVPAPLEPVRLLQALLVITLTALALVSVMFLLLARVGDPMVPRIASMLLNTLLFFPSGAVYPQQALPGWLRAVAVVDPFTYAVRALRTLLVQGAGLSAIARDLLVLTATAAVAMILSAAAFRRSL
ncbi:MAG TPA: ABC transporter permease [Anaeromyxobacter sp.]|nr:ABC transporter permease [Anaeromyxobacter sp.]